MAERTYDVAIVGGGVIGAAVGYYLTGGGARVAIIERRLIAQEASWASAGIIAPGGGSGAPDPRLAMYDLTQRLYPELIPRLQEESGVDVEYLRCGELMLALEAADVERLRVAAEACTGRGYRCEWLDAPALREYEPALSHEIVGALALHAGGTVRAARLTTALIRAAQRRGLTLFQEEPVIGLTRAGDRITGVRTPTATVSAGTTVIAAGAWSRLIAEGAGVNLPTLPVRGQMMSVEHPTPALRNVVAGLGGYVLPRGDGTIAVGATEEHDSGFDTRVTPAGLTWLSALLTRVLPAAANSRVVATWAGLRPGSADGLPMIGPVEPLAGLWSVTGHFRSGIQLAPATGKVVADSLLSGRVDPLLVPFAPNRFDRPAQPN